MCCLHLKYGLYEKVATDSQMGELSRSDVSKIRSIYAFISIYCIKLEAFHKNKQIKCKYTDYLGKGLKEYHENINICSGKNEQAKYFKKFKEFQEIYNEDNLNWETSKENKKYIYAKDNTAQCALEIESHNNPLHLTYWYNEKKLHLRNKHIGFQKSTIISTSSAIGTTVGVTSFLLYLYKYTSFRLLFGNRNQQDNITFDNMDAETHNFILPTSEIGNTHFENNYYNIAYISLNNY
ncbi:PIR Superfamily Protein [Plasmodium ovale curtisi]|uniref:PIR Superfamily Protein n=1 Tax=Plasmodium ovale curtisi TaxID=864141 RepID=A0A1A8WLZ0_PLAOA|nr:PIR Superfamily Protein [Plasmodium ovale curtisi]